MESTMTTPATQPVAAPAFDPVMERSLFFSELEMLELVMTIPQASPPAEPKNVY
jgi:hypothetical protein